MVLEARAGLRCVENIGRQVGCHRKRHVILGDNLGLTLSMSKRRSSNFKSWLSFVVYVLMPLLVICGPDLAGSRPNLTLQMSYLGSV